MNWQQFNWPLALLIYGGLLLMFGAAVVCSYLPIKRMTEPEERRFHVRWLTAIWSFGFVIGFVLPTLGLFGVLPNWSILDPAATTAFLIGLIFMVYMPNVVQTIFEHRKSDISGRNRQ
jgi:MFS family permease